MGEVGLFQLKVCEFFLGNLGCIRCIRKCAYGESNWNAHRINLNLVLILLAQRDRGNFIAITICYNFF